MSEQRKQILKNLAETLEKINDEGLKAIEIFSSGVAAVSAKEEKKTEEKKDAAEGHIS